MNLHLFLMGVMMTVVLRQYPSDPNRRWDTEHRHRELLCCQEIFDEYFMDLWTRHGGVIVLDVMPVARDIAVSAVDSLEKPLCNSAFVAMM
jgi:hypothetical protein